MPETQCEAVLGTNPVLFMENFQQVNPLTTHFKYITNLCIKTKVVGKKNTQ